MITPYTNINYSYKTKGSHIQKWESAYRRLIKDTYELPTWTKNEILHTITGIPHFRVTLLKEAVSKLKRWRYLISSKSPLSADDREMLKKRLKDSTLVRKVSQILEIDNPILPTTDWKSIQNAVKLYVSKYWNEIKSQTRMIRRDERGNTFIGNLSFYGWKLKCQMTVSRTCTKPQQIPDSQRTKCPGCHTSHRDFETCLISKGFARKKMVNGRLARILLVLKSKNRSDLIGRWPEEVAGDIEWRSIDELLPNIRIRPGNQMR